MALTKKDIEVIAEIINNFSITNDEMAQKQIDVISQSVVINTNILNQIKLITENSNKTLEHCNTILTTITNGLDDKINNLHTGLPIISSYIGEIHKDVCAKDGYLPKISNKLTYMWIPLLAIIIAKIVQLIW